MIIEFWRRDERRRFRSVLALGAAFVGVGSLVVAAGLAHRGGGLVEWLIPVGVVVVACGPGSAIVRMHRLLTEESYLSVRTDGIEALLGGALSRIAWDDLAEASYDAGHNAVVLARRDGSTLLIDVAFDGIAPQALAKKLEHMRRKAGMSLL